MIEDRRLDELEDLAMDFDYWPGSRKDLSHAEWFWFIEMRRLYQYMGLVPDMSVEQARETKQINRETTQLIERYERELEAMYGGQTG